MKDDEQNGELPEVFRQTVAHELETRGFTVSGWHADGLDYLDPDGEAGYLGLANLHRRCRNVEAAESQRIIQDFLEHILESGATQPDLPDQLERVRHRILVRVGQPFRGLERLPWSKRLPGTDLSLNLVIDFPNFMTYVTSEQIEHSHETPGDWLDQSIENLKDRTPTDWLELLHPESGILVGHLSDSYDASRALILADIVDTPPGGWVVAIPSRDWLFCCPATSNGIPYFHLLKVLAEKNYQNEPYPVSDEVFWIHGHRWERFPMELVNGSVQMTPPDGFLKAIGFTDHTLDNESTEE
ncbi:MAG: hypothetical protein LC104_11485 [Bacteroidales bacterium]|nr:hypothetical protein [Bacteroidales bacterium]